jgi:hypothetical protein
LQTAYNRNRNSANTPTTTIHKDVEGGSTDGTRIFWKRIGSGNKVGAESGSPHELILKQNTKYLITITNLTALENNVNVELSWYEHISKVA